MRHLKGFATPRLILAGVLFVAAITGRGCACDGRHSSRSTLGQSESALTNTAPNPRNVAAIASDPAHRRVFMYGGASQPWDDDPYYSDLWIGTFDGTTLTWSPVSTQGTSPGVRHGASLAYDSPNNRLILFGGYDGTGYHCDRTWASCYGNYFDVWVLDLNASPARWAQVSTPGTHPDGRHGAGVAWDPDGSRLFIYSGNYYYANEYGNLSDTWQLTLSGLTGAWQQITGSGPPNYSSRFQPALVWNAHNQILFMYGGYDIDDGHVYQLLKSGTPNQWFDTGNLSAESPRRRDLASVVWDDAAEKFILFGGYGYNQIDGWRYFNDVWTWGLDVGWSRVATPSVTDTDGGIVDAGYVNAASGPRPRASAVILWDSATSHLAVWGGMGTDDCADNDVEFTDTSVLSMETNPAVWTVDPNFTADPPPVIWGPQDGASAQCGLTLNWIDTSYGTHSYDIVLNGTVVASGVGGRSWTVPSTQALNPTGNSWSVRANRSCSGNTISSASATFTTDGSKPQAPTLVSPTNNSSNYCDATYSATARQETGVVYDLLIGKTLPLPTVVNNVSAAGDGAGNVTLSAILTGTNRLTPGAYLWQYKATNCLGSTLSLPRTVFVAQPAAAVLNLPAAGATTGSRPTFTWSVSDTHDSTFSVYVDGHVVASRLDGTSYQLTPAQALASGAHAWHVQTDGCAGATAISGADQPFTVDGTLDFDLLTPSNGTWFDKDTINFSWQSASAASYALNIDSGVAASGLTETSLALSPMPASFDFSAQSDANGWTLDAPWQVASYGTGYALTPTVSGSVPGADVYATLNAAISVNASTQVSYTLNSNYWDCYDPYSNLALQVQGTDGTWTDVDHLSCGTVSGTRTFSLSSYAGQTVHLRFDRRALGWWTVASYDYIYIMAFKVFSVAEGRHSWSVTASDAEGNTRPSKSVRTFGIDHTPPEVAATYPASQVFATAKPTLKWTAGYDSLSGVDTYHVNIGDSEAGSVNASTLSWTPSQSLDEGLRSWSIDTEDAVGRTTRGALASFNVDLTAPLAPALDSPAAGATVPFQTPDFCWEPALDPAGGADCGVNNGGCDTNADCVPVTGGAACACKDGYTGNGYVCYNTYAKDCLQLYQSGIKTSGYYPVNPDGAGPIQTYCDMTTAGGGWTQVTSSWSTSAINTVLNGNGRQLLKCGLTDSRYIESPATASGYHGNYTTPVAVGGTWIVNGNNVQCGADPDAVNYAGSYSWGGFGCSNGGNSNTRLLVYSPYNFGYAYTNGPMAACYNGWNTYSVFVRSEPTPQSTERGSGISHYELFVDGAKQGGDVAAGDAQMCASGFAPNGTHSWYVVAHDKAGWTTTSDTNTFTTHVVALQPFGKVSPGNNTTVNTLLPQLCWHPSVAFLSTVDHYSVSVTNTSTNAQQSYTARPQNGVDPVCVRVSTALTAGNYTWQVTAFDADGGSLEADGGLAWGFTAAGDTTAPTCTISAPTAGQYLKSPYTLGGTGTDGTGGSGVSKVEYCIDTDCANPTWTATTLTGADPSLIWGATWTAHSEGNHTIQCRAVDREGNVTTTPPSVSFAVDSTPPVAFDLLGPSSGSCASTTPTFSWASTTDAVAGLDHYELSSWTHGQPQTTETKRNVGTVTSYTPPTNLASGTYDWTVYACDAASNCRQATQVFTISLGQSGPNPVQLGGVTPSTTLASQVWSAATTVTLSWQATTENGCGELSAQPYTLYFDGTAQPATDQLSFQATSLAQGQHTWRVDASDTLGNVVSSTTATFFIDTQAPSAPALQSPPTNTYVGTAQPVFGWNGVSDSGVGVGKLQLFIDGTLATDNIIAAASSIQPAQPLTEGEHTWQIKAADKLGNTSSSETRTIFVDTTGPSTFSVTQPANGALASASQQICWTATTDPSLADASPGSGLDHFEVALNGSLAFSPDASKTCVTATNLQDGTYELIVSAIDKVSNKTTAPTVTFTVDAQPPAAFNTVSPANNATLCVPEPTFCWQSTTDSGTGVDHYELWIDGSNVASVPKGTGQLCQQVPATLAPDTYSWFVKAVDGLGQSTSTSTQTLVIAPPDLDAPSATITSPSANTCAGAAGIAVSGSAAEASGACLSGLSKVEVSADGTTWQQATLDNTGHWSITWLPGTLSGAVTLKARATDAAGNVTPLAEQPSLALRADTAAPASFETTAPADGAYASTRPTFTWDATTDSGCGLAGYSLVVQGQAPVALDATTTVWTPEANAALTEGTYKWHVVAIDTVGQTTASDELTFTVDTTPPAAPVLTAPACGGWANSVTGSATWTATDAFGSICQYSVVLDSNPAQTVTTATWLLPAIAAGQHTLQVTAIDCAGNVGPASDACAINIDNTPPGTPAPVAPTVGQPLKTARPTFSWTAATDNASGVCRYSVSIDGSDSLVEAPATSFTPGADLPEGAHTWTVAAIDCAGNTGTASTPSAFLVDLTGPGAVTFTAPAEQSWVNTATPTVTWTAATDSGSGVASYAAVVDLGAAVALAADASSFVVDPALTDGPHCVTVTATDAAGNAGTPAQLCFTVDTVAPGLAAGLAPADDLFVQGPGIHFTWTAATDDRSGVCGYITTLDEDDLGPAAGELTSSAEVSDGLHTWTVRAVDCAGNEGLPAEPASFNADSTAPLLGVLSAPTNNAWLNTASPALSWTSATDTGAGVCGYVVTLDGTPHALEGEVVTFTPETALGEGAHEWKLSAKDCVGNASADSTASSFYVDLTAPSVPVIATPAEGAWIAVARPTLGWQASQDAASGVASYTLTFDEGAPTSFGAGTTSFIPSADLTEGQHCFTVTATDTAGNTSAAAHRCFGVDRTPPSRPTATAPVSGAVLSIRRPVFTWSAATDGSGVTSGICAYVLSVDGTDYPTLLRNTTQTLTTNLADGTHTWTVRATDCAGNQGAPSASLSFTIDTTAPDAPVIIAPTDEQWSAEARLAITWNAVTDSGSGVAGYDISIDGGTATRVTATSFSPAAALADGHHCASVKAIDNSANSGTASTRCFNVDTTAPVAPAPSFPASGGCTNNATPLLSWTRATDNGSGVQSLTLLVDGSADTSDLAPAADSATVHTALTTGTHTWGLTAADKVGLTSTGATATLDVDVTAPTCTVTSVEARALAEGGGFRLHGTASDEGCEGLDTVEVSVGDGAFQAATVAEDGTWTLDWTLTPSSTLSVQCRAKDNGGLVGQGTAVSFHTGACFTQGACDANGNCSVVVAGNSCDDGNVCTSNDVCQADGACTGTAIPACGESDGGTGQPDAGTTTDGGPKQVPTGVSCAGCSSAGDAAVPMLLMLIAAMARRPRRREVV